MPLSSEIILPFLAASFALSIAPGPDNIFVLTQSALHGYKAGLLIMLGLFTGLLVHISAVALGVATLLHSSTLAFTALKIVGTAYLSYLAWQAFHAGPISLSAEENTPVRPRTLYLRGILMSATNPKVALFFLAFLPQFTRPAHGSISLQILLLGFLFMLAAIPVFASIAWGADRIGTWLKKSPRAQIRLHRATGIVFLLLATRLLFSRQ